MVGLVELFLGVLVSGCCDLIVVRELVCVMLAVALVDGVWWFWS